MVQDIKMWPSGDGGLIPRMRHVGSGASDPNIDLNILAGSQLSYEGDQGQLFSITNELQSGVIFSVNDISGLSHLSVNASGEVDVGEYSSKITMHKAVYYPVVENTQSTATLDLDLAAGNHFQVNLGANVTAINFANSVQGQRFIVRLTQDGTGSRTVVWTDVDAPDATNAQVIWPGGTAPTLTTTADKSDTLGFICTSGTTFFDGYIIGQNL